MSDSTRFLSLTVSGGLDLEPVGFSGAESLSAPFSVEIAVVTSTAAIDPNQLLFTPACLTVAKDSVTRYFNGVVRAITGSGRPERGFWRYTLTLVPKLWFMGQTSDCRIFQAVSISSILQTLCGEASQTVSAKIFGTPAPLDYVTQYNETDLHFFTRLLEQAGYFYYFDHTGADHTLVITDQNQGFASSPKPVMQVIYEGGNLDVLSEWRPVGATATGKVQLLDYDPAQTGTLTGTQPTKLGAKGAPQRDTTRWPGLATDAGVLGDRAKIDIEAAEAEVSLIETEGGYHGFSAGSRFTVNRDPFTGAASQTDYVVRSIHHHGADESRATGGGSASYDNAMVVFPVATAWRERVATPRPQMAGIHAAIVLGDTGEEIHADALARVKVRLMWDHRTETVADQAIWARVISPWAGNSWGAQHLPRVGTEVAVAFMDGDPDHPVVVGGFYNASMAPIFPVPDQQTKSGFRSRSTAGGGTANFSELSVDDKSGSELFYVHAEKDMTREVENDDKQTVGNAQTIDIAAGRTVTIKDKGDALTVQGGDLVTEVSKGSYKLTIDQTDYVTTVTQGNHGTTVSAGNLKITASAGAVSIEAMQSITLKVGENTVTIDQSGVSIKGMMVKLEGQTMLSAKATMLQLSGDGMAVVKGGVVMIN